MAGRNPPNSAPSGVVGPAVAAALAILCVAGCAASRGSTGVESTSEEGPPWEISISRGTGNWYTCVEEADLPVEASLMSADLPSTHAAVVFKESVTREEAQAVLDCIQERLDSGEAQIRSRQ
jgi:hypothetical protein